MDYEKLKKSVRKIELSDEMSMRIIRNCDSKKQYQMEEMIMNKNSTNRWFKKPLSVAAVLSFCLCLTITVAGAGSRGFFKDITDRHGTVIGTQYQQASDEIEVSVIPAQNEITVSAVMTDPNVIPYIELEYLGIESYQIVDLSGNVIVEGVRTDLYEIVSGETEIKIPLEQISSGNYKLVINAFVGSKKADQPLQINGTWECAFSI